MFDSGISYIAVERDHRSVDAMGMKDKFIKYNNIFNYFKTLSRLSRLNLISGAMIWSDVIFRLDGIHCGLRDQIYLPARMALLKRAFFCKRSMRDPIPEGLDLQGLNFPFSF
jgi:hypothetical protein